MATVSGVGAAFPQSKIRSFSAPDRLVNAHIFAPVGFLAAVANYAIAVALDSRYTLTFQIFFTVGVTLGLSIYFLLVDFELYLYFWVSLALLQNFLAGIWAVEQQGFIPIWVTESKTISLACALFALSPRILSLIRSNAALAATSTMYCLALALALAKHGPAAAAYGRNFVAPIAILLLAVSATRLWTPEKRLETVLRLARYATVLIFVGTIAEITVGTEKWRLWLRADINGALNSLSESTDFFGFKITRIGGTLIEPTNAGYCAASVILIAIAASIFIRLNDIRDVRIGLFPGPALFCLLASGAKSGLLMLLIAVASAVIFLRIRSVFLALVVAWAAAFAIVYSYVAKVKGLGAAIRLFADPISILGGESTTFHLAGLVEGIMSSISHPFGSGLGVGGNFNLKPGQPWLEWIGSGGESAVGAFAFQTGLFGLIAFALLVFSACKFLGSVTGLILAGWTSSAMFAEAMFGPQVCGLLLVAAGMLAMPLHHRPTSPERSSAW